MVRFAIFYYDCYGKTAVTRKGLHIKLKGILNINKPAGLTSTAVVGKVKRIFNTRAVGHMGTLDPQGTGVLLIGVGKATRLFDFYLKKDKVYDAEFEFGYTTDTLDKDGIVTEKSDILPTKEQIEVVMMEQVGKLDQIPPQYSAKSVGGVRAYSLARKGIEVELKPSQVEVYSIEILEKTAENKYMFRICCSAGTYVRSICRDIAATLNTVACMTSIHRVRAGQFCDKDSVTIQQLEMLKESALVSCEDALESLPKRIFDDELYFKIDNGVKIPMEKCDDLFTVWCKGEMFGIGTAAESKLIIKSRLKD